MEAMLQYPKACRESIKQITQATGASVETAYAMMLITATLMDLYPGDERVVDIVLQDCGATVQPLS